MNFLNNCLPTTLATHHVNLDSPVLLPTKNHEPLPVVARKYVFPHFKAKINVHSSRHLLLVVPAVTRQACKSLAKATYGNYEFTGYQIIKAKTWHLILNSLRQWRIAKPSQQTLCTSVSSASRNSLASAFKMNFHLTEVNTLNAFLIVLILPFECRNHHLQYQY